MWGKGSGSSVPSLVVPLPPHFPMFISLEEVQTQFFGIFMRLRYIVTVKSLAIDWFNLQPFLTPQRLGFGTECSNPSVMWLVLLATSPPPLGQGQKSLLLKKKKKSLSLIIRQKKEDTYFTFMALKHFQELWMKTKYMWQTYFGHLNEQVCVSYISLCYNAYMNSWIQKYLLNAYFVPRITPGFED